MRRESTCAAREKRERVPVYTVAKEKTPRGRFIQRKEGGQSTWRSGCCFGWRSVIFLVINAFCCDSSACGAFFLICNRRVVNLIALCIR